MFFTVLILLLGFVTVYIVSIRRVTRTLQDYNQDIIRTSADKSSASMNEVIRSGLLDLVRDKADLSDRTFSDFEKSIASIALATAKLYENPERNAPHPVPAPDPQNNGILSVQTLYAEGVSPEDPAVMEEAELLGNLEGLLYALNDRDSDMVSCYFGSAAGIVIQADMIAGKKFDDEGNLLPLNPWERPWYSGSLETGRLYFTPITHDYHTGRPSIMCGIPVYQGGKFRGAAGAGMYLDGIEDMISRVNIGETGNAFIMNQEGQVLFSTYEDGLLQVSDEETDLLDMQDEGIRSLVRSAVQKEAGVDLLNIDGTSCCAAYAPMKTVGWTFFIILPQEEVDAPSKQLLADLNLLSDQAGKSTDKMIQNAFNVLVLVLLISLFLTVIAALILSSRVTNPIRKLTDKVSALRRQEPVTSWDLGSDDETQLLADHFETLTEEARVYVENLQSVTAEKERIGAELNIATQIQVSMLPSIVPPISNRDDFGIYASMDPAREVGGDFYDFFLIDEDHLGLVIADVCGKGVPAALFMMASKIILANNAMMGKSPAKVLEDTNNAICSNNKLDMFVTVWFGIMELSTGKITAANAGHEYPVIMNADGRYELVKDNPHGFAVGGFPEEEYTEYEWQLRPGQKLFLYTDGLPEAMTKDREPFGTDRILEVLNADTARSPKETLEAMSAAVGQFVGDAEQFDDLTMLAFEYLGNDRKG